MTRQREFQYSTILVHPPLNLLLEIFVLGVFAVLLVMAIGDDDLNFRRTFGPVIIVLFLLIVFHFFWARPYLNTWQRRSGMRKAAARLGFEYAVTGQSGFWSPVNDSPPPIEKRVSTDSCDYHKLSGERNNVRVTAFDHRITRRVKSSSRSPGNIFTHVHAWYNVVQIDGNTHFPQFTLAPTGRLDQPPIPIEGTSYNLYPTQGNIQRCQKVVTEEVIAFLSENPGWIIQFDSRFLTAFDARRLTLQRPIPQNLPAFIEDVLHLHSLLRHRKDG